MLRPLFLVLLPLLFVFASSCHRRTDDGAGRPAPSPSTEWESGADRPPSGVGRVNDGGPIEDGSEADGGRERGFGDGGDTTDPADGGAARRAPSVERSGPTLEAEEVRRTLEQISEARAWRERISEPTEPFINEVSERFDDWAGVLAQLSSSGQRGEADQICDAIVALRAHWGPRRFPPERYDSFLRDRFWLGGRRIEGAQFFEPVRWEGALALFRWSEWSEDSVLRRYHLLRRRRDGRLTYVLLATDVESGEDRRLRRWDETSPGYWVPMAEVMADLTEITD